MISRGRGTGASESRRTSEGGGLVTWAELVKFIRRTYELVRVEPDEIRIRLRFGVDIDEAERGQVMIIAHEILDGRGDWVQIATPFARADEVDLRAVLEEAGSTLVVGNVVIMGDYVVLRHTVPLINLDDNEFVDPLHLVAAAAEQLEKHFTGRDDY
jgi:hypothetical protein